MDWLSSREALYWISGKPGSGKSTLVDYLVGHDRTKRHLQLHNHMSWIITHFFFDFRGGKSINNNFEGLLRSLLYQLIESVPQLDLKGVDDGEQNFLSKWHERRLRDALHSAFQNFTGGVCIFVDGLDEYEGSVRELIQLVKSLATNNNSQDTSIKVCLSSRPEPIPSEFLQHLPNLSMSAHNASGIQSYCRLTFDGLEPVVRKHLDISELSYIVAKQAEGVFLWARFAMEELIQGHCEGEDMDELLERLEKVPRNLEDVYDRILSRMEPSAKKECMIMLRLVCFAKRELSWQELLVATKMSMNKEEGIYEHIGGHNASANDVRQSRKDFVKRIRAKAVGLLEFVRITEE